MTEEEIEQLRIDIMTADLALKRKQAFWETPKGLAAVVAALAVTIGTLGGVLGYQIGRGSAVPAQQFILPPGTTITIGAPPHQ